MEKSKVVQTKAQKEFKTTKLALQEVLKGRLLSKKEKVTISNMKITKKKKKNLIGKGKYTVKVVKQSHV